MKEIGISDTFAQHKNTHTTNLSSQPLPATDQPLGKVAISKIACVFCFASVEETL